VCGYDRRVQRNARWWGVACASVAAAFLATVATYYHPGAGFTAFIEFPASTHGDELPIVRETPHYDHPESGGYDGQFYAQIALAPLLRDPAIDRALDNPPYRARRILFSWTAYALGLGRPWWVLQAYSLQNVAAWLLAGWLLFRMMSPMNARTFALWCGCLLSHGFLSSVRYALPDAPSTVLLAAGLAVGGPLRSAFLVGLAALGRETAILGMAQAATLLSARRWRAAAAAIVIGLAPLALWIDYLRSVYRGRALAGGDHITSLGAGLLWKIGRIDSEVAMTGVHYSTIAASLALAGFAVQAGVIVVELARSRGMNRWALTGAAFVALALVTHQDVYAGTPGAFTRVFLPVTFAANVLLAGRPRVSWALIVAANLGVVPGVLVLADG
jgi:hypothetical protein